MKEVKRIPRKLKKRLKKEVSEMMLGVLKTKNIRITHLDTYYKTVRNACAFRLV